MLKLDTHLKLNYLILTNKTYRFHLGLGVLRSYALSELLLLYVVNRMLQLHQYNEHTASPTQCAVARKEKVPMNGSRPAIGE